MQNKGGGMKFYWLRLKQLIDQNSNTMKIPGPDACSEMFLESKLPLSILYLPGPSFLL